MTVDLSTSVKGSKVYFRCGGEDVVKNIENPSVVYFESGFRHSYWASGYYNRPDNHPLDIIRIEPPAFDWYTVKPGMAFKQDGELFFYIGPSLSKLRNDVVFGTTSPIHCNSYGTKSVSKSDLVRSPEHDITPSVTE